MKLKDILKEIHTQEDLMLYSNDVFKALPKAIGKWKLNQDKMSGTWEWYREGKFPAGRPVQVYATLFWDGDEVLPIDIMDDNGDMIGNQKHIKFKPTWNSKQDATRYVNIMKKELNYLSKL